MTWPVLVRICGEGMMLAAGVVMLTRPQRYVGTGIPPATDPRTVRFFGGTIAVLGGAPFFFDLFKLISE